MSDASEWGRQGAAASQAPGALVCRNCGERLGGRQKQWCSKACKTAAWRRRRNGEVLSDGMTLPSDAKAVHEDGPRMVKMRSDGYDQATTAKVLKIHPSRVSRGLATEDEKAFQDAAAEGWSEPDRWFPVSLWDLTEDHLGVLVDDFMDLRSKFFHTERSKPYMTPGFQAKWLKAILRALVTGGRLVILSPSTQPESVQ